MTNNLLSIIVGDILVNKQITYKSICALATADAIIHQYEGVFNIKPFMNKWIEKFPKINTPRELTNWCSTSIPHMLIDDLDALSIFNICGAVVGLYANSTTEARTLIFNACPGAKTEVIGDAMAMSEAFYLMHNSYDYDTLHTRVEMDYYMKYHEGIAYEVVKNSERIYELKNIAEVTNNPDVAHLLYSLLLVHLGDIPNDLYNDCWDNYLTDVMKTTIIDFEQVSNGRQQD